MCVLIYLNLKAEKRMIISRMTGINANGIAIVKRKNQCQPSSIIQTPKKQPNPCNKSWIVFTFLYMTDMPNMSVKNSKRRSPK